MHVSQTRHLKKSFTVFFFYSPLRGCGPPRPRPTTGRARSPQPAPAACVLPGPAPRRGWIEPGRIGARPRAGCGGTPAPAPRGSFVFVLVSSWGCCVLSREWLVGRGRGLVASGECLSFFALQSCGEFLSTEPRQNARSHRPVVIHNLLPLPRAVVRPPHTHQFPLRASFFFASLSQSFFFYLF